MRHQTSRIVLASASSARRQMLAAAGISVDIQPADIDEDAIKHTAEGASDQVATMLAQAKARKVSAARPDDIVIGSDQVLVLDGQLLSKPLDLSAARRQLQELRGRTHELFSAVALARSGNVLWTTCDVAKLTMRDFSDAFLDNYMAEEAHFVCQSVGAYRIEGPGVQLFSAIAGDERTILGMPLLPVLEELRKQGYIER